jgi:hypothetical protein
MFRMLCTYSGKWGLYLSFDGTAFDNASDLDELYSACPLIRPSKDPDFSSKIIQSVVDGHCVFLFDDENEVMNAYRLVVGDDGPTEYNLYAGKVRVYALTCDPDGILQNENT